VTPKLSRGAPKPQGQREAAIAHRDVTFLPYEPPPRVVDLALARAVWDATNRSPEEDDDDGEPEHRD